MIGSLSVVGVGPGDSNLITPEVSLAMVEASDFIGYGPYLNRIHIHKNKTLHASDNRKELERAELGLELAQSGKKVVIVSSGDPGVFAMASAVMEGIKRNVKVYIALSTGNHSCLCLIEDTPILTDHRATPTVQHPAFFPSRIPVHVSSIFIICLGLSIFRTFIFSFIINGCGLPG